MKLPEPPVMRDMGDEERNLVLSSWLRTYTDASTGVERSVFFRMARPVVLELLDRSAVRLACMPEHPSVVYGWVCTEGDVLHYVCVKPRWQRFGIASWLLADVMNRPMTYTHRTPDGMRLPVPASWTYAPMRRFVEAA